MRAARQFDLCRTRGEAAMLAPYLVVLQSDWFDALESVVVAPVRRAEQLGVPLKELHLPVEIEGEHLLVTVEELVSLPRGHLGEVAGTLAPYRADFVAALDRLFLGI